MSHSDPGRFQSTPPSTPPDEPYPAELVEKSRFGFLPGLAIIVIIVGVVVGPLLYLAAPAEITRWKIASAEEKRLNGDLPGALQDLDRALERNPDEVQLLAKRVQWQIEAGNYEAALADCNRILELRPGDPSGYVARSQVYQYLGRHAESVADWKTLISSDAVQTTSGRAFAQNGLAYARALANTEIAEALVDIDEAMRREGERYEMLDTRGFLYYRQGDFDRALKDLNRSVEVAREDYEQAKATEKGFGLPDRRQQEMQIREQAKQLAVILYHRGLAHQGRGDKEEAEQDFERVRELGFEPDDKLF